MNELPKTIIIANLSEFQKAKVEEVINEVIDLLRKKYKLTIEETAYALNNLVEGFNDTVRGI